MPRRSRTHRPSETQDALLDLTPQPPAATLDVPITVHDLAHALAGDLEAAHQSVDHHEWEGTPYAWIRHIPSAARGKVATALVARTLAAAGLPTEQRANASHDLRLNGRTIKVRMSTRWSSGEYTFQNLTGLTADILILVGVSPDTTHMWALPLPLPAAATEELTGNGWLTVPAARPPEWMGEYGGNDTQTFTTLTSLAPGRH